MLPEFVNVFPAFQAAKLRGEGNNEENKEGDIGNSETQFYENGGDMSTRSFGSSSKSTEDANEYESQFEDPCSVSDTSFRSHGSPSQKTDDVNRTATQFDRTEKESNASSKSNSSSERTKHANRGWHSQFSNAKHGRNVPSWSSGSSSERTRNSNKSAGPFNNVEYGTNDPSRASGISSERTMHVNSSVGKFNNVEIGRNVPPKSSGSSSQRNRSRSEQANDQFNGRDCPGKASFRTSFGSSDASKQGSQFDQNGRNGKNEHLNDEKKTKANSCTKERPRDGRFSSENRPMRRQSTKRPSNSEGRESGLKNNGSKANLSQRTSHKKVNLNRNGDMKSPRKVTDNMTASHTNKEDNVETIGDCDEPLGITLSPYFETGKYWVKYCIKKILEIVLLAVAVIALVLITVGSLLWILGKFLLAVIIKLFAYFWSR